MGATRAQRGLPPPGRRLSGAPEKNLPKELRRLSAKLMANRSDRHLSNLSNSQGAKPVRLIRKRCADFHHGPECNAALHQEAGYMTAIAHQAIRAATLRTGLGPYMRVRIDCAPPASLRFQAFSREVRKLRTCSGDVYVSSAPENAQMGTRT